jgi:hypothetical protein
VPEEVISKMKKFEYKIIMVKDEETLNALGAEGWLVIDCEHQPGIEQYRLLLAREHFEYQDNA